MSTRYSISSQRQSGFRRSSAPSLSTPTRNDDPPANRRPHGNADAARNDDGDDQESDGEDNEDQHMPPADDSLSIAPDGIPDGIPDGDEIGVECNTRSRQGADQVYTALGSTLCRKYEMFGNAINTIKAGYFLCKYDELDNDSEEGGLPASVYQQRPTVRFLVQEYPGLLEEFELDDRLVGAALAREKVRVNLRLGYIGKLINVGRAEAKNNDVKNFKKDLPAYWFIAPGNDTYGPFMPPPLYKQKHTWGLHHPQMAPLLTPLGMSWDNPEHRLLLLQPHFVVGSDKLYPFQWAGRLIDDDRFLDGMFDSDILDKLYRRIYFGSAEANFHTSTEKSNMAKKHGITEVTEHQVAYTSTIARHGLSSEPRWDKTSFSHPGFYRTVRSFFSAEETSAGLAVLLRNLTNRMYQDHNALPHDNIPSSIDLIRDHLRNRENARLAAQALELERNQAIAQTAAAPRDPVRSVEARTAVTEVVDKENHPTLVAEDQPASAEKLSQKRRAEGQPEGQPPAKRGFGVNGGSRVNCASGST